jgi:hypothetical protein
MLIGSVFEDGNTPPLELIDQEKKILQQEIHIFFQPAALHYATIWALFSTLHTTLMSTGPAFLHIVVFSPMCLWLTLNLKL